MSKWSEWKKNQGDVRPWDLASPANYTDEDTSARRYSVCLECPELINMTKQCKKCGCLMHLKTKLKEATCPIGKW